MLFMFLACHTVFSVPCSLVVTCWERTYLLALLYVMFSCVFVTFPSGGLGQVCYLVVLIPDLCLLPNFAYILAYTPQPLPSCLSLYKCIQYLPISQRFLLFLPYKSVEVLHIFWHIHHSLFRLVYLYISVYSTYLFPRGFCCSFSISQLRSCIYSGIYTTASSALSISILVYTVPTYFPEVFVVPSI